MTGLADWTRSTACSMGSCVEARLCDGLIELRDTRQPGPVLHITPEDWAAFLTGAKAGEFDLPDDDPCAERIPGCTKNRRHRHAPIELRGDNQ